MIANCGFCQWFLVKCVRCGLGSRSEDGCLGHQQREWFVGGRNDFGNVVDCH